MDNEMATGSTDFLPSIKHSQAVERIRNNDWLWFDKQIQQPAIQPLSNMGTGFIEYKPPQFLIEAHKLALDDMEYNQYGPHSGMPILRKALAEANSHLRGGVVDPETEVSIHSGATEALLSAVLAFVDPGEEVILLEPFFSAYVVYIVHAQAIPRYVPLHPPADSEAKVPSANDWTLDLNELEAAITPKTKLLILNNPHNPLGKVFTADELRGIGDLCVRKSVLIVSDEVYSRIPFTPSFTSLSTISPSIAAITLTVGSIGKLFNATGWRLGYIIGPAELIYPVRGAHYILCYTTAGPVQKAAAEGLREADRTGWWKENLLGVKAKVDSFCKVLDELEIQYVYPAGAYFVLVNTAGIQIPSKYTFPPQIASLSRDKQLCWFLINEIGVAAIPGSMFYGPEHKGMGENYLRFGVCKSPEGLELAMSRLRKLKAVLDRLEN